MGYVNLNEYAKGLLINWGHSDFPSYSPFLDPQICQEMVLECHKRLGIAYSYGGWLEDRTVLWRGCYLEKTQKYIHLGVDVNAPIGTPVAVDMPGDIILIDNDQPLACGWGNRVMIKLHHHPIVLIYAHLDNITQKVGATLKSGDVLAEIGSPSSNGNWYPHVHVQAMSMDAYQHFLMQPKELDGYGTANDVVSLAREFPYPLQFFKVI